MQAVCQFLVRLFGDPVHFFYLQYDQSGERIELPLAESSSSRDDSVGERWDWGWETMPNGTLRVWGDGVEAEPKWKRLPKMLSELKRIPTSAYRRLPDPS